MSRSGSNSPVSSEDKADIVLMIEDGWADEDILECMPHIKRGSVTAFRAHVARGTYSQGDLQWNKSSRRLS